MRLYLLRAPLALVLFMMIATASAGNAATVVSMRGLAGTQLPLVRQSTRLAAAADATPVSVVLSLQPRNRGLLARTAVAGSAAMSVAQLRQTFAPGRGNVIAITRYMRSRGFRLTSSGLLTLSFSGDAAAARRAFGVGLSTYRAPSGREFRAPDGAVRLPAGLAPLVEDVSGLDTALRLQRHVQVAIAPNSVLTSCQPATAGQNGYGAGYQPDELAQAYNHDGLIAAGGDGSGETIGLVEFTNYRPGDINGTGLPKSFMACYGLTNTITHVPINGGSGTLSAAIEAELDIEVAVSNAPGIDEIRAYDAHNNVSQILPMLDRMILDNVTVVSDSWGLCEAFLPPSFMEAEATHLEMLAAGGISFFAATGDSGSSDCAAASGGVVKALVTDDPASQPFATGTGGTTMPSPDRTTSSAWKYGGGGVSQLWPQPVYQSGNPITTDDGGSKCGNPDDYCRQVPDVALDANPNTGYIIHCTVTASGCPSSHTWFPVGGTSAAAPLMAAIAADANTYSVGHGGGRMGFANPFLYSTPGSFFDVINGNNSITGHPTLYHAHGSFDLATGLGSPDAMALATALAAYTPAAVSQDATQIAISTPAAAKTITYGKSVTFSGTLKDSGSAGIPNRRVHIELTEGRYVYVYVKQTDNLGNWSLTLSKALRRNLTWSVNFAGSDTEKPDKATGNPIRVIPHLGSAVSATRVQRGTAFTFHGASTPNMHGVKLQLQMRRSTFATWNTLGQVAVSRNGSYAARITVGIAGPVYLRWRYAGGPTKPWMSALSPARHVTIL